MKREFSRQVCEKKKLKYQVSSKSVQWEPSRSMQTDGLIAACRNFANTPKNAFIPHLGNRRIKFQSEAKERRININAARVRLTFPNSQSNEQATCDWYHGLSDYGIWSLTGDCKCFGKQMPSFRDNPQDGSSNLLRNTSLLSKSHTLCTR